MRHAWRELRIEREREISSDFEDRRGRGWAWCYKLIRLFIQVRRVWGWVRSKGSSAN